jgi:hypothetical protein
VTRIFLSYTGADREIADHLTEAMTRQGVEVYNYGDHPGEQFVKNTQAEHA